MGHRAPWSSFRLNALGTPRARPFEERRSWASTSASAWTLAWACAWAIACANSRRQRSMRQAGTWRMQAKERVRNHTPTPLVQQQSIQTVLGQSPAFTSSSCASYSPHHLATSSPRLLMLFSLPGEQNQPKVKRKSPSFSMELTTTSPFFNQTCLSLG